MTLSYARKEIYSTFLNLYKSKGHYESYNYSAEDTCQYSQAKERVCCLYTFISLATSKYLTHNDAFSRSHSEAEDCSEVSVERPSKFGGSFNQPNVPTINVVVDMVAPQRRIAKIIGGEVDVKA